MMPFPGCKVRETKDREIGCVNTIILFQSTILIYHHLSNPQCQHLTLESIQTITQHKSTQKVGALRRISILPQKGWNKNIKQCDGGPGGSGTGGELKTDYVVVPTATMVEQEACYDKSKQPFPQTYAQERRMAQRFDQSLIMEVRLVNVS